MELNIPLVLKSVLEDYVLPWHSDHGVVHWARVLENGLRLAEDTGANEQHLTIRTDVLPTTGRLRLT